MLESKAMQTITIGLVVLSILLVLKSIVRNIILTFKGHMVAAEKKDLLGVVDYTYNIGLVRVVHLLLLKRIYIIYS